MYYRGHCTRSYIRSDWYMYAKLYKNKAQDDKDKLLHIDNKPEVR